jgi:hypothetical protein
LGKSVFFRKSISGIRKWEQREAKGSKGAKGNQLSQKLIEAK